MRIKLTISYIGTNFCGWQSQKNGDAIQDRVEKALSQYFGGQFVRIFGAGRTDVGVHAMGQVAHFDIDKKTNPYKLCLGANLNLPPDIAITNAEIVDDSFDARFSAVSKTYCYRIYTSDTRIPLLDATHHQVFRPLNVEKMQAAATHFVGTHDFSAFQKTGSNLKGTIRTINFINITQTPITPNLSTAQTPAINAANTSTVQKTLINTPHSSISPLNLNQTYQPPTPQNDPSTSPFVKSCICIFINGNAFLYNMVRILAGTLVKVGKNQLCPNDIPLLLKTATKPPAKTLPAKGLTLEQIQYK